MVSWHHMGCAGVLALGCSCMSDATSAHGRAVGESRGAVDSGAVDSGAASPEDAGRERGVDAGARRRPRSADAAECGAAVGTLPALRLAPVTTALSQPTFVASAPGDETRLFV